ncbi:unnamed protein product [Citrullus colocynthis]|uniref:Uncharacterized protein n=1 Tax=Citrullus colocynthis TaxID=252529 RepID=A0ABP0YUA8_9ROSI
MVRRRIHSVVPAARHQSRDKALDQFPCPSLLAIWACRERISFTEREKRERETLRAGKLNERVLKLFVASGKDEVLSLIEAFNIQQVVTPVLPTRCSEKF